MTLVETHVIIVVACTVFVPVGYWALANLVNYVRGFLYDGSVDDWDPIYDRLGEATFPIMASVGFGGSLGIILLLNFPAYTLLLAVVAAVVVAMLFLARAVIRLGGRRD